MLLGYRFGRVTFKLQQIHLPAMRDKMPRELLRKLRRKLILFQNIVWFLLVHFTEERKYLEALLQADE